MQKSRQTAQEKRAAKLRGRLCPAPTPQVNAGTRVRGSGLLFGLCSLLGWLSKVTGARLVPQHRTSWRSSWLSCSASAWCWGQQQRNSRPRLISATSTLCWHRISQCCNQSSLSFGCRRDWMAQSMFVCFLVGVRCVPIIIADPAPDFALSANIPVKSKTPPPTLTNSLNQHDIFLFSLHPL